MTANKHHSTYNNYSSASGDEYRDGLEGEGSHSSICSIGPHILSSPAIALHCGGRVPVSWLPQRTLE